MNQIYGYTPADKVDGEQYHRFLAVFEVDGQLQFQVRNGAGEINSINVPRDAGYDIFCTMYSDVAALSNPTNGEG